MRTWIAVGAAALSMGIPGCAEDQSDAEERGEAAIKLCQGHGGVVAFDDDIVICRDQSVRQGEL